MTTGAAPPAPPDDSDAGWSSGGSAAPPAAGPTGADPFSVTAEARYTRGGLIGVGGMGEVWTAWDARLRREVAWKRVRADGRDPAGARLAHEAWITAQLEHPGVVPVYDAGRDDAGRHFYTMRLVRGRTLGAALAAGEDRLRLLRLFLVVCETVAFAHSRGIIHRDLKPSNILLGPFGEVLLVDWGIARRLDIPAADAPAPAAPPPPVAGPALTRDGAVVGSAGYMSPEQAAGAPVDTRSDVWSLGQVLADILDGPAGPAAPPALRAIAARARAADPAGRYPEAGALAADLAAWLDGRRVEAHSYTPWEAAKVVLAAWRVPLRVAVGAILLAAAALATGVGRVRAERDRATASESAAQQALAHARTEQAVAAARAGQRDEAERHAAAALALGPDPRARGVFVGFGVPRPTRTALDPLPCAAPLVRGDHLLCVVDGRARLHAAGGGPPLWDIAAAPTDAAVSPTHSALVTVEGQHLVLRDLQTGAPRAHLPGRVSDHRGLAPPVFDTEVGFFSLEHVVLRLPDAARTVLPPCGPGQPAPLAAARPDGRHAAVLCVDGTLRLGPLAGPPRHTLVLEGVSDGRGPTALALGEALWLGYPDGRVERRDPQSGAVLPGTVDAGSAVRGILLGAGAAALTLERGNVLLIDDALETAGLHLPVGERTLRLGAAGLETDGPAGHTRWTPSTVPDGLVVPSGIAALAATNDTVVIGAGNGLARALGLRTGAITPLDAPGGLSVIRGVATTPGGRLALGYAGGGRLHIRDAAGAWSSPGPAMPHRRLGARGEDILALGYVGELDVHPPGGPPRRVPGATWVDLSSQAGWVWLLDADGGVWAWPPEAAAPSFVAALAGATGIAAAGPVAVAHAGGRLYRVGKDGAQPGTDAPPGRLTALATDGARIAVGDAQGQVHLYGADDARFAIVQAHTQRVSALAFTADALWSAGWDGRLRRLAPDAGAPPPTPDAVHAAWGRAEAPRAGAADRGVTGAASPRPPP